MKRQLNQVREFQDCNGFKPVPYNSTKVDQCTFALNEATKEFVTANRALLAKCYEAASNFQDKGDIRYFRFLLMFEEFMEVAQALKDMDREKLADGLGDLMYTVLGTATQFHIPLDEVFEKIHTSNMSKTGFAGGRRSAKGEGFAEADFSDLDCSKGHICVEIVKGECAFCSEENEDV